MPSEFLKDRVVLMIGAGRWPGPQLALALASQGATVAANDLSPVLLDPLCEAARPFPGMIKAYIADATRGMPLRAMLDEVLEDWGRIDVLINNPRVLPTVPMLEMDEWDWQRTVEMNLSGPFLASRLVARSMQAQGQGTILNIVDTTDVTQNPGNSAYAASQAGLLAFSQAAARELMAYNIRVYTLCPDRVLLHNQKPVSEFISTLSPAQIPDEPLAKIAVQLSSLFANDQVEQTLKIGQSTPHRLVDFAAQE